MTKATNTLKIIDRLSKTLFWSMISVLVLMVGLYAYMVNQTVWNAFGRDNAEEQIVALNSKLADLEFEYIKLSNEISMEKAISLGFKSADKNTIFATREIYAKSVAMK